MVTLFTVLKMYRFTEQKKGPAQIFLKWWNSSQSYSHLCQQSFPSASI